MSTETPDWSKIPVPQDDGAARYSADMPIDLIPGARGCTPQPRSFRHHFAELRVPGLTHLFGLSTQDTLYQREAAERLHLPFPLLFDAAEPPRMGERNLTLARAMRLPTFETSGMTLLKRLTLIIKEGILEHVFYSVFPPDRNASDVMAWLTASS